MPLRKAEVTGHAWQRFMDRWEGPRPPCFRSALHRIIEQAQEEDLGYGQVLRLMANYLQPARYFLSGNWRLVVNEELTAILTIERPFRRGTLKQQKTQKRRRRQKY